MPDFRKAHPQRRGGVLALVLIVVLTIGALTAGMLQLGSAVTRRQASTVNRKLAFYMAEAGLAEAYAGLAIGKTGNVGTENEPAAFAEGLFWVEATQNPDATVTLEATGMVGNGRAVLSMVVEPELSSVAALGVFAENPLDIQPGSKIDGWNSEQGAYVPPVLPPPDPGPGPGPGPGLPGRGGGGGQGIAQMGEGGELQEFTWRKDPEPEPMGRLGSNGGVHLSGTAESPTEVHGDVTPGPSDTVDQVGAVTIFGSTEPALDSIVLPPVTVPTFTPQAGIVHSSGIPLVLPAGQLEHAHIVVQNGAEVVLQGPLTIVLDRLIVEAGGALSFDTANGGVNMYVKDVLDLAVGSQITTSSQLAQDVTIQVPDTTANPVALASTSDFYGIVYAPKTTVEVHTPFEVFGSVVAETLSFVGPARMHFDRNLIDIAEELALPRLVSWRVVEISNPPDMGRSVDPFDFLGINAALCPPPGDAHADQNLDITYRDKVGVRQTYNGPESAFDWGNVWDVQAIKRDGVKVNPDGGLAELGDPMLP